MRAGDTVFPEIDLGYEGNNYNFMVRLYSELPGWSIDAGLEEKVCRGAAVPNGTC